MVFGHIGREMTEEEIDDFLRSRGHGLLSLADGDVAYGIPMSYGYDADTGTFVMEFLFQAESRKRGFLVETEEASLCVYTWESKDAWRSVIASGRMDRIDDDERICVPGGSPSGLPARPTATDRPALVAHRRR